jgi:nicotinamidase-related amidase
MQGKKALLMLDLINEIVHPEGKYAHEGYLEQVTRREVLANASTALARARAAKIPIIHVVVGFSRNYVECPAQSAVFSVAREDQRLLLGTWATQIHNDVKPLPHEPTVVKNRVSPFYQTHLELLLRSQGIDTLLLAGVSTEFVVLTTAIEAHDRDYQVEILEDATAASNAERHDAALKIIARTAKIHTVSEALPLPA